MISSVVACGLYLDSHLKKKATSGYSEPEHRLPPMVLGTIVSPVGLIIFGWTAQKRVHYIVPIGSTNLVGFGFVAVFLASSSYLVDAFRIYAASATAATTVLRNAAGRSSAVRKAGPRLGCHNVRLGGPGCSTCAPGFDELRTTHEEYEQEVSGALLTITEPTEWSTGLLYVQLNCLTELILVNSPYHCLSITQC